MKPLSFNNFFNKRKTDDTSSYTRKNYGVEGKAWYHPDTNTLVPVTKGYHTREVAIHPDKFNLSDDDIRKFYTSKSSKTDADRDVQLIRDHDFMDWSDEIVHGMHDKGWLRVTKNPDHMYVGGNNANHVRHGIHQMVKHGHITPEHKVTAHLYDYGKEGFNGKVFNLTYDQAKQV
jgi:hypothetical protein